MGDKDSCGGEDCGLRKGAVFTRHLINSRTVSGSKPGVPLLRGIREKVGEWAGRFGAALMVILIAAPLAGALTIDPGAAPLIRRLEFWRKVAAAKEDSVTDREYIEMLAVGVRETADSTRFYAGDREGVHRELTEKLISLPGHAIQYRDRISAARKHLDKTIAEGASGEKITSAMLNFDSKQRHSFETLSYLRSVETVQVLGEFLVDGQGLPDSIDPGGWTDWKPNSVNAAKVFSKLGIDFPPLTIRGETATDVEAWRIWYRQVRAGKRTFRFIGNPIDYDLRGPSPGGARDPGVTDERPGKLNNRMLPWLVALAMCVLGGAFYIRSRGKTTGG